MYFYVDFDLAWVSMPRRSSEAKERMCWQLEVKLACTMVVRVRGPGWGMMAFARVGTWPKPSQLCLSLGFYFSVCSQVEGVGLLGHRAGQG